MSSRLMYTHLSLFCFPPVPYAVFSATAASTCPSFSSPEQHPSHATTPSFLSRNDITPGWFNQVAVHLDLVKFVTAMGIADEEFNSVYQAQFVALGRLAAAALQNKIESQGKNFSEYMSDLGKMGAEALKTILEAQGIDVSEYYQALGAQGAAALRRNLESRGIDVSEYYQALGACGGEALKRNIESQGMNFSQYMSDLGKLGTDALKKKVESQGSNMSEYMSDIARDDDHWDESLARLDEAVKKGQRVQSPL